MLSAHVVSSKSIKLQVDSTARILFYGKSFLFESPNMSIVEFEPHKVVHIYFWPQKVKYSVNKTKHQSIVRGYNIRYQNVTRLLPVAMEGQPLLSWFAQIVRVFKLFDSNK